MALVLLVPVCDVLIFAGGVFVFFESGRDLRRGGAFDPVDCSSEEEEGIDDADSVGRVRNWRLVAGRV